MPARNADGPGPADPVTELEGQELFARAMSLAQGGDLVRAEQYIVASIQQGYPEDRALPALLRVCVAASRMRVALGYAQPYLQRHPDDWRLRYLVATIHHGLGNLEQAQEELLRVIEAAPNQPMPRYLLATILVAQGEVSAGQEQAGHYLRIAPSGEHARELEDLLDHARVADATQSGDLEEASPPEEALEESRP
jgi:Flp pilus assembly protein TadD